MNRKLGQAQERHFKDPDLGRTSRSIAFTDAEWEIVNEAVEISGMKKQKGIFITSLAQEWLTLHELRKVEGGL